MPTLSIVTIDEEMLDLKENVLRQKALEVPVYTSWYLKWCEKIALEMFEIMYTTYGAALAAPQVGIQLRLIVMDPARVNFGPHALINPIITYKADNEEASSENCLSLPQLCGRVFRSTEVHVSAINLNGVREEHRMHGLLARIIQHELDHLDGVLYTDRLRPGDKLEKSDRGARRKAMESINKLQKK